MYDKQSAVHFAVTRYLLSNRLKRSFGESDPRDDRCTAVQSLHKGNDSRRSLERERPDMHYATAATLKGNVIRRGKRVSLVSVNAFGHCRLVDIHMMNRLL